VRLQDAPLAAMDNKPLPVVTEEVWDPRVRNPVRGLLMAPFQMLFAFVYLVPLILMALLSPGYCVRHRRRIVSTWGKLQLAMLGIRLDLRGSEHLSRPGPAILLFNHQSIFDLLLISAIWPESTVVLYKQEFHKIPIIGRMLRAMDMLPIDRSDRQRAVATMAEAATRIREKDMKVMISPEGTRSRTDGLQQFKRGAFHLAIDTGAPMIPMVLQGVRKVVHPGSLISRAGTIRIDVLEPIDTSDWTVDNIDQYIDATRAIYTSYVPPETGTA
jgi:putative phosphoserine phosphatase/1-acylglycerol-3-phosphate O-acyltransferase